MADTSRPPAARGLTLRNAPSVAPGLVSDNRMVGEAAAAAELGLAMEAAVFMDRREAGDRLLPHLPTLDPDNSVIVALPRGGLPVADGIARALGAPLDISLVRKVGVPGQPEYAVAAVTDGADPSITVNADVARMAGLDDADIRQLAERELPEIRRRRDMYLKGRPPLRLAGKHVVVVDDGIATGATMRAALRLIRGQDPARLIVAVPVAPKETIDDLRTECDEIICLETPPAFRAVGLHYRDFGQVSDTEVAEILEDHARRRRASPEQPMPRGRGTTD